MRFVNRRLTKRREDARMVVRTRLAAILMPLAFYVFSGVVGSYFVWHAAHGQRGLEADQATRKEMADIEARLKTVRAEEDYWRNRIALLRGPEIDRDLLDEQARTLLDHVGKSDLMIFLSPAGAETADSATRR
jgi:cell division protein FtsB